MHYTRYCTYALCAWNTNINHINYLICFVHARRYCSVKTYNKSTNNSTMHNASPAMCPELCFGARGARGASCRRERALRVCAGSRHCHRPSQAGAQPARTRKWARPARCESE